MSLFKYVVPDRADVIRALLIRFTPPGAANDPFEFRPLVDSFYGKDEDRKFICAEIDRSLQKHLSERPPLYQRVFQQYVSEQFGGFDAAKCRLDETAQQILAEFFPAIRETIFAGIGTVVGVLSLSETSNDPVMWAHYAANHSGFVIEFDDSHPWFWAKKTNVDEIRHLRKVVYIGDRDAKPIAKLSGIDVFYTKLSQWEYEKEWRIIRPLEECSRKVGSDLHLFAVPPLCIRSLIIGARASRELELDLLNIVEANPQLDHLEFARAFINYSTSSLEIVKVERLAMKADLRTRPAR